jgi:TolA-binding protein
LEQHQPRHLLAIALAACSLSTAGGCVSSSREEALRTSIASLEVKVSALQRELADRDQTLKSKSAVVDSASAGLEDVKRQVSMTQGAVDELRVKLARLSEAGDSGVGAGPSESNVSDDVDRLATLEERIAKLEQAASSKDAKGAKSSGKAAPKYASAADLTKVLGGHFSKKEFKKVDTLATEVLNSNLGPSFKETALLFRAESAFASESYKQAAGDFGDFLTKYPKSDRRARALLLAGDSFVYLKQLDQAKTHYKECVDKFPKRPECVAAKERLDRLGS